MVEDVIHLPDAGRQRRENGGIRQERDDRRDDELGLGQKRRERAERVDVWRIERKADFLVCFSVLCMSSQNKTISMWRTRDGRTGKQKKSLQRCGRDPSQSRLLCRLGELSVQDGHEGVWNVW